MVGHLDELRARLLVSLAALAVAFGICFWQNHELLRLVNKPLAHQTQGQVRAATARWERPTPSSAVRGTSPDSSAPWPEWSNRSRPATPRRWPRLSATFSATSTSCTPPEGDRPVTLGIGEPFTATLTVTFIFALILSLPVLLLQAYGFFMPAVSARDAGRCSR